ncbi:hypothetical protein OAM82_02540 [Candidatus Thioglobus sp.]|nr:hypothetical protein [Candidatus Thioglobus sp.]
MKIKSLLTIPVFVFLVGCGSDSTYDVMTSNKWDIGLDCGINGGAWMEYGPQFQIGEKLTAGGKHTKDSDQKTWFEFTENDDGTVTLRNKIYAEGNKLVSNAVGSDATVSDVTRVFSLEGEKLRVKSTIKSIDLYAMLESRLRHNTKKENILRGKCS